jgi:hypothetical protein
MIPITVEWLMNFESNMQLLVDTSYLDLVSQREHLVGSRRARSAVEEQAAS